MLNRREKTRCLILQLLHPDIAARNKIQLLATRIPEKTEIGTKGGYSKKDREKQQILLIIQGKEKLQGKAKPWKTY